MSSINANNISSINATITNLNVGTINGKPVSQINNCFCNDCSNNDNPCPQCQSYDNCSCQEDDGVCPECIPYEQFSCNTTSEGVTPSLSEVLSVGNISSNNIILNNGSDTAIYAYNLIQLPVLISYPAPAVTGMICCANIGSTGDKLYFYNGTTWNIFAS
jgi:hypothetical protein